MVKPLESCHLSLEMVIKAAAGRKPVFKRSHSSEKCVQDEDKRCARSSIVLSKPFCSDGRYDSDSVRVDLN